MHHSMAPGGLNLRYALLQATVWGTSCALTSFAALFLLGHGFSNTKVGTLVALSNILGILIQPWVAARRMGAASLIALLAGLGATFGCAMLLFGRTPVCIALLFAPLIVVLNSILGPMNALCMDYVNRGIPLNYGFGRGIGSLGFAAVSYLLGNLAQQYGMHLIPLTYTVLFLLASGLALSFLPPRGTAKPPKTATASARASGGIVALLTQNKPFATLLLSCFFLMLCSNSFSGYMANIMAARGGGSADMGAALSLGALLELPAMAVFPLLMRRYRTRTLLLFSAIFLTAKAGLLCATASVPGVFAAQLLQPLGYALFIPASVYCTNQMLAPHSRALGQTLMMAANTLATVAGSLGGGLLLDWCGTTTFLAVGTSLSAVGILLTFFAERPQKTRPLP
ncbi:MAG: MFS transporter [Gemmiger sp.]|nr:MFS transporter [Gemmiger sp.]